MKVKSLHFCACLFPPVLPVMHGHRLNLLVFLIFRRFQGFGMGYEEDEDAIVSLDSLYRLANVGLHSSVQSYNSIIPPSGGNRESIIQVCIHTGTYIC